jgi:hypothetical protein
MRILKHEHTIADIPPSKSMYQLFLYESVKYDNIANTMCTILKDAILCRFIFSILDTFMMKCPITTRISKKWRMNPKSIPPAEMYPFCFLNPHIVTTHHGKYAQCHNSCVK